MTRVTLQTGIRTAILRHRLTRHPKRIIQNRVAVVIDAKPEETRSRSVAQRDIGRRSHDSPFSLVGSVCVCVCSGGCQPLSLVRVGNRSSPKNANAGNRANDIDKQTILRPDRRINHEPGIGFLHHHRRNRLLRRPKTATKQRNTKHHTSRRHGIRRARRRQRQDDQTALSRPRAANRRRTKDSAGASATHHDRY